MQIEEVDLDKPGEREVLVQIKAASLCHSDLSTVNADQIGRASCRERV